MENKLITLAIHKKAKAWILKEFLESKGIIVCLEEIKHKDAQGGSEGYYVKIDYKDLSHALLLIEETKLFSYDNLETYNVDDGRKRVLVAVDFSDYSMKACQVAFNIAKEMNAKVKILHVYQNIYFPSHIPFADSLKETPEEGLLDKTRKQMLDLCMKIDAKITEGKWPSVNYSYSLREGQVDEEIEAFVLEYKPALLVLGTKGKDDNKSSILGNVTADVIEIVNVPVLAVPESSPINSIDDITHVAFLTNLHKRDFLSFAALVEMLHPYQIKITLLHINPSTKDEGFPKESELLGMKEYLKEHYDQLHIEYRIIDSPDIPQAIADFVEKEEVTIVCLNTRRRNLFGRIFAPSISRKVLTKSDKALLVLRG